jgi:FMN phosphatase YigB (HAD superfamily)
VKHKGFGYKTYIFDIDGTLADVSHRLHLLPNNVDSEDPKFDDPWKRFMEPLVDDTVIEPTANICRNLHESHMILMITGRRNEFRKPTIDWLNKHKIPFDGLLMRKDGDRRQDQVVKRELYRMRLPVYENVAGVFEDRTRVVEMWRELGLVCYQVCKGDY